jgi:hypothetical protein
VAREEAGRFVEPFGRQQDVASEAFDEASAAEVSDREADVVAGHGGDEAKDSLR